MASAATIACAATAERHVDRRRRPGQLVFNTALNGTANVDTIKDFNIAANTIQIDNAFFLGLSTGALAASAFKDIALAAADANPYSLQFAHREPVL